MKKNKIKKKKKTLSIFYKGTFYPPLPLSKVLPGAVIVTALIASGIMGTLLLWHHWHHHLGHQDDRNLSHISGLLGCRLWCCVL